MPTLSGPHYPDLPEPTMSHNAPPWILMGARTLFIQKTHALLETPSSGTQALLACYIRHTLRVGCLDIKHATRGSCLFPSHPIHGETLVLADNETIPARFMASREYDLISTHKREVPPAFTSSLVFEFLASRTLCICSFDFRTPSFMCI